MNKVVMALCVCFLLLSCGGSNDYVPKPHAFPRMEFPEKKYVVFDSAHCPYTFEIPVYAGMVRDTNNYTSFQPCWYNLNFAQFNATLHITYYRFNNWEFFDSLVYDSRKLVNKHLQRADDIVEETVESLNPDLRGVIFSIQGNTATNYNFYATDSSRNFIRGALYFNAHTQQDSIAPAFQFIKKDIEHLISTLHWK
jgi:gliding motility-associated lipoprotein GldD